MIDSPFPPMPPDYTLVLIARLTLVEWAIIGVVIVVHRLREWKHVRSREIRYWIVAAGLSFTVSAFGTCEWTVYDDNAWLLPALTAALGVSVAGITLCLCKVYLDATPEVKSSVFADSTMGSIIACVLWLLLEGSSLVHPREASLRTQCKNNLKQIGVALHNYADEFHTLPPAVSPNKLTSWRVSLLPYLDQKTVYSKYDLKNAWDQSPNDQLAAEQIQELTCGSNYHARRDEKGRWFTAYSMLTGPQTVGANPNGTSIASIADGTSNTLLVVEASGAQIVWSEPRDIDVSVQSPGVNLKGSKPGNSAGWLSSYHHRGAHGLLADGSVRFISAKIDPKILNQLATIDGGEQIGEF